MTIPLLLAAAAAVLFFWPSGFKMPTMSIFVHDSQQKALTFAEAIDALSVVQSRLSRTNELDDEQREAVDVLTLALVRGSVDD